MASSYSEVRAGSTSDQQVTYTVVSIYAESGTYVEKGAHIFDMENQKAVAEVYAPVAGFIDHDLRLGSEVAGDAIIATVSDRSGFLSTQPSQVLTVDKKTARDASTASDGSATLPSSIPPQHVDPLPPNKLVEIETLRLGAAQSMHAVIGKTLPLFDVNREDAPFFRDKIIDLVIYHASRLMKRFRKMNAEFVEGGIRYHQSVAAGVAFDKGGHLVLYRIAESETLSLTEIQDRIIGGFERYTQNIITPQELSPSTFSVTDLSGLDIDFMFPLLPQGQSCIIGIARAPDRGFRLFLGFDHRITEGLEASQFLSELCDCVAKAVPLEC